MLGEYFLNQELAERGLEQYLGAVADALIETAVAGPCPEDRETVTALARRSELAYRALVEDHPFLVEYVHAASLLGELGRMNIGSRPPRRSTGTSLTDLRAIPWIFAWTQSRVMLPIWYGVTAFEEHMRLYGESGLEKLQGMAERWAWFRATLENLEVALAKADLGIGRLYAELVPDAVRASALFDHVAEEYNRSGRAVLRITRHQVLLENEPALRASIALRNPYVDPLNYLQVIGLRALRARAGGTAPKPDIEELVLLTVQGVAQGLRTTG